MIRFLRLWLLLAVVGGLSAGLRRLPGQDRPLAAARLTLLDGTSIAMKQLTIRDSELSGDGLPANLEIDDLRRIESLTDDNAPTKTWKMVVELRGGGRLQAASATIAQDKCRIEWEGGEPLSLPIDSVRALRLSPESQNAEFDRGLANPPAELDQAYVEDEDGGVVIVSGMIQSLTGDEIKLIVGGRERRVPRTKLFGLVVAQPDPKERPPHCLVTFRDGSRLGGDALSLAGDRASLRLAGGTKAEFTWRRVAGVAVRSARVAMLSELTPLAEEQTPLVTLPLAARRDKSVSGSPLKIGDRTYEKGLGVHARSSLTFATDKKWDTLAATIGIDAAGGTKGDCVFVVLVDDRPMVNRRIKGTDPPAQLHVAISGSQRVTLLVEPGEGLDLGDHADWCDARFLRGKK